MNILIVQTAFIGDVILITPLIRAVHKLYPQASIDALVVPAAAKLLENNPHLRTVIPFAKRKTPLLQMAKQLKGNNYDLAISPHSSNRTHLLLWLAGIPRRIGFDRNLLCGLLTDKIPHPNNIHKINKNLQLLKFLSNKDFSLQTELFPSQRDKDKADNLLQALATKPLIAMAPGSIWATKCWLLESYIQLAIRLLQAGYGLVLIGGDGDREKCLAIEQAAKDFPDSVINLSGKTNLLESAAVIARCRLMLCNDSGALHIANAVQTRVFAFFGPTVQTIGYYPFRAGDRVFETDLKCRPCGSHGHQTCPKKHHNCMKQITVDEVYQAVREALPVAEF